MWYVTNSQTSPQEIFIALSESEHRISGNGEQEPRFSAGDNPSVRHANAAWSILSSEKLDTTKLWNYDNVFKERVAAQPEMSHHHITPSLDDEDKGQIISVFFCIVLPPKVFSAHLPFWQRILFENDSAFDFQIGFEFLGFPVEGTKVDAPIAKEWTNPDIFERQPLMGTGVNIIFKRAAPTLSVL